jgi:hypothetical protein
LRRVPAAGHQGQNSTLTIPRELILPFTALHQGRIFPAVRLLYSIF